MITPSLIRELADVGALVYRHGELNVKLKIPIYDYPRLANYIADLYYGEIEKIWKLKWPGAPIGIIGASGSIAPTVTLLGQKLCTPIVTIAPDPSDHERITIFGTPRPNYHYFFLDDVLKTGRTLASAFGFWLTKGFTLTDVVVFCDMEMGGQARLREEALALGKKYKLDINLDITYLTTRGALANALVGLEPTHMPA